MYVTNYTFTICYLCKYCIVNSFTIEITLMIITSNRDLRKSLERSTSSYLDMSDSLNTQYPLTSCRGLPLSRSNRDVPFPSLSSSTGWYILFSVQKQREYMKWKGWSVYKVGTTFVTGHLNTKYLGLSLVRKSELI